MKINTQLIENYIKDNNLTKTEFCKRCEISRESLRKILKNERVNMTYSIVFIANAMNVDITELLLK